MKKFKFLIISSLLKKIKTKAFVISMIITSVLILAITIIPSLINFTPNDIDEETTYEVVLIDQTNQVDNIKVYLENNFALLGNFNITLNNNYDITTFFDENIDYLIIYEIADDNNNTLLDVKKVQFYANSNSPFNSTIKNIVVNTKLNILIDQEQYAINLEEVIKDGTTPVVPMDPNIPDLGFDATIMGFSTIIFTVMFMFIIISTQSMGAEILEEKSSKAIETIISSAPAEMHFYSKIISSVIFTAIQILIMLIAGITGVIISNLISTTGINISELLSLISSGQTINFTLVIIVSILSVIFGLVLYLILFAFLASFANNNEEYQKAITPMMIILLIIFYGSMILTGAQQIGLIKGLAFIPFFTPFLLPLSVILGTVNIIEIILIFLILIISILFFTYLLLPAYKVSILSYSNDKLFKEISRSIKTSRANKRNRKNNLRD